uniref:Protein phosphatase 1 regulatory subunit 14 n=1 Tax=Ailuropoda melanoleuca TaxID=9646 RepID=A0A7N5P6R7_AILME
MSVATGSSEAAGGAGGGGARVFFQSPRGGAGGSPGSSSGSGSSREDSAPVATAAAAGQVQQQQQQQQRRHQQGKVTVKYDRKELRKRLVLEEWIVEQLGQLYGCENYRGDISYCVGSTTEDLHATGSCVTARSDRLRKTWLPAVCLKPPDPARGGMEASRYTLWFVDFEVSQVTHFFIHREGEK